MAYLQMPESNVRLQLSHSVSPFRVVDSEGRCDDDEYDGRLEWLRDNIIGSDAEFDSPFGRRRITYCDHTASGRFLRVVEDYLQTNVFPYYGNTHTGDSYVGRYTTGLVQEATSYVKHCIGAGPRDVLLFCGNGCTAAIKRLQEVMGLAVSPILSPLVHASLPPSDRWVVFVGPYEHHSNLLSWRQSLAEVVDIGLNDSGQLDIEALEKELRRPEFAGRHMLGSFSACSNVTGMRTDTRAIARVLHEHGAYASFDFATSGPYVKIEMKSGKMDGYDAVFLSPHKFLGGPGSPGILLMSDRLYRLKETPPSTCGGGTVHYVNGYSEKDTLYHKDIEEREDAGTPAITQKIRAALAFKVKEHVGHMLIHKHEAYLSKIALERLTKNDKLLILGNTNEDRQPIISFLVYPEGVEKKGKALHCQFVTVLLNDLFGIQARGGCACAGPYGHRLLGIDREKSIAFRSIIEKGYEGVKPGFTRVTFGYYFSDEEIEFILNAIEFVAQYGHHFLSLYEFNWKTGDWRYSNNKAIMVGDPIMSNENEHICEVKQKVRNRLTKHNGKQIHPKERSTDTGNHTSLFRSTRILLMRINNLLVEKLCGQQSWIQTQEQSPTHLSLLNYMSIATRVAESLPAQYLPSDVPVNVQRDLVWFMI